MSSSKYALLACLVAVATCSAQASLRDALNQHARATDPAREAARNAVADPQQLEATLLQKGRRTDTQLTNNILNFQQNFPPQLEHLLERRDANINNILNMDLSENDKVILVNSEQRRFNHASTQADIGTRMLVEERLIYLANDGLGDGERIEVGLGKPRTIETADGQRVINPDYSGLSDTDVQSGRLGMDNLKRVARTHGLHVTERSNTITINEFDPDLPENEGRTPTLDLTLNRHAKNGRSAAADATGSSSQAAQLYSDALDPERFLSPEMPDSPLKVAVEKQDHLKKASKGRNLIRSMGSDALLNDTNQEKLQAFGKSTRKMSEDSPTRLLDAMTQDNDLGMSTDQYSSSLENVHNRSHQFLTNVTEDNVQRWAETSTAVQDEVIRQANDDAQRYIRQERAEIRQEGERIRNDKSMTNGERRYRNRRLTERRERLQDGISRLDATTAANQVLLGNISPDDGAASTRTTQTLEHYQNQYQEKRRSLQTQSQAKGFQVFGKVAGTVHHGMLAVNIAQATAKGDYGTVGKIVLYEAGSEVVDRAIEYAIPGFGMMHMAANVGYGTGRLIGENVKLCADCKTVDGMAEDFFVKWDDILTGKRDKRWAQERLLKHQQYLNEMIDDWGVVLPQGMSRGQAMEYALSAEEKGGDFVDALDTIFNKGERQQNELIAQVDKQRALEAEEARLAKEAERVEQERQKILDAREAHAETESRKQNEKQNTLSMFRKNLAKEQSQAERTIDHSGRDNVLDDALQTGADEVEAFKRYEQAKKDNIAAKKHLAEVEERIRRQEAERARRDAEFWSGMQAFVGGIATAANDYQQAKIAYADQQRSEKRQRRIRYETDESGQSNFEVVHVERGYNPPPPAPVAKPARVQKTYQPIGQLSTIVPIRPPREPQKIRSQKDVGLSDVSVNVTPTVVKIWDHSTVDGDRVQVSLNGRVIYPNVSLARKKFSVVLHLHPGVNRLDFKALNIGTAEIPKNSAAVSVYNVTSGSSSQKWSLDAGQTGSMIVNFQP